MSNWSRLVVHFEIRGRDKKRLQEFYAELFGWNIAENEAINYAVIEHGISAPDSGISFRVSYTDLTYAASCSSVCLEVCGEPLLSQAPVFNWSSVAG